MNKTTNAKIQRIITDLQDISRNGNLSLEELFYLVLTLVETNASIVDQILMIKELNNGRPN